MALTTTSGTVSGYAFNLRRVIEHAARRAGKRQQLLGAEDMQIATDCVYTITSQWINAGFPLWTRTYSVLGIQIAQPDVQTPVGTVDVLHCYWRSLMPWRGNAMTTAGAGAAQLVAGQPNADLTIAGPNPGVIAPLGGPTWINTIGVLPGAGSPVTAALEIQASQDGVTFATVQTLPSATYTPGQWTYFDLNPPVLAPYLAIVLPSAGSWTLNQVMFGLPQGQDTEIGPLNIDDYWNQPDKFFQGTRANSAFVDRQLNTPVIKIWPTVSTEGWYNGTVTALMRRYIQDPGALTNAVEVPQRWAEALIWRLAKLLMFELPDPDPTGQAGLFALQARMQRMAEVEKEATKAEALAWGEERSRSPFRFAPNLHCYTA
jgi:hypothetical protein